MTNTPPTTPRRPLVPGPGTGSGIAAKAVALREAQKSPGIPEHVQAQIGGPIGREVFSRHSGSTGKVTRAIANVMKDVGRIQMTGYNQYHKYRYPKMEDILPVVCPLMGEHGLVIHQNEIDIKNIEGNRIAVTYEFIVFHESGESLPPARHTGMAIARDSKGNWDDKCVAKCHTNARKFHLQALYEIPMELPDNEPESTNANQRQKPVPGPAPKRQDLGPEAGGGRLTNLTSEEAIKEGIPHKIKLGQGAGADQWANAYLKAIASATTVEILHAWDKENDQILQSLSDKYPDVYEMVAAAFERRESDLGVADQLMPKDPQEAMNWVAGQLQGFKTYEAAETFWNDSVAPREKEFDDQDWNMLMKEWERTEARLNPPDDEPEAA